MTEPSSTSRVAEPEPALRRVRVTTADEARAALAEARAADRPVCIVGGGGLANAAALDRAPADLIALTAELEPGRMQIEPDELVASVSAGTPIAALEETIRDAGVMLPFEPAWDRNQHASTSVGGLVGVGLSGSRRPWAGSLRDAVLGVCMIDAQGQRLEFGGRVMKNVAGFDVARLLAGSFGSLGIIETVHFKLLPQPRAEASLRCPMPAAAFVDWATRQRAAALPLSGLGWWDGQAHLRLSGGPRDVEAARERLLHAGDATQSVDTSCWNRRPEQRTQTSSTVPRSNADVATRWWRLAVPPATAHATLARLAADADWVFEWGGALRFCRSTLPSEAVRSCVESVGGTATIWSGDGAADSRRLHPRTPARHALETRVRRALDPECRWWSPFLDRAAPDPEAH